MAQGRLRALTIKAGSIIQPQDPTGEVLKWVGMNVEITERKRAEEQLRRSR